MRISINPDDAGYSLAEARKVRAICFDGKLLHPGMIITADDVTGELIIVMVDDNMDPLFDDKGAPVLVRLQGTVDIVTAIH